MTSKFKMALLAPGVALLAAVSSTASASAPVLPAQGASVTTYADYQGVTDGPTTVTTPGAGGAVSTSRAFLPGGGGPALDDPLGSPPSRYCRRSTKP